MSLTHRMLVVTLRALTRALCRIDDSQLGNVPQTGPLIIVTNHVNIVEIPAIYTHLQPRAVTGIVASVRWENLFTRWLLEVAGAIPLHRGEPDITALRRSLDALQAGRIIVISPEGTRSGHGRLQQAHPGFAILAARSGAPILPLAFYGHEYWKEKLVRLQRADLHIAVGQSFRLNLHKSTLTRPIREQITNELMYRIAALLPPQYRGIYSDLQHATQEYLIF